MNDSKSREREQLHVSYNSNTCDRPQPCGVCTTDLGLSLVIKHSIIVFICQTTPFIGNSFTDKNHRRIYIIPRGKPLNGIKTNDHKTTV